MRLYEVWCTFWQIVVKVYLKFDAVSNPEKQKSKKCRKLRKLKLTVEESPLSQQRLMYSDDDVEVTTSNLQITQSLGLTSNVFDLSKFDFHESLCGTENRTSSSEVTEDDFEKCKKKRSLQKIHRSAKLLNKEMRTMSLQDIDNDYPIDKVSNEPPLDNADELVGWIQGFLPKLTRAKVIERLRAMISNDVQELRMGHVVLSREFRAKIRSKSTADDKAEKRSFSVFNSMDDCIDDTVFPRESELISAYIVGSVIEQALNKAAEILKENAANDEKHEKSRQIVRNIFDEILQDAIRQAQRENMDLQVSDDRRIERKEICRSICEEIIDSLPLHRKPDTIQNEKGIQCEIISNDSKETTTSENHVPSIESSEEIMLNSLASKLRISDSFPSDRSEITKQLEKSNSSRDPDFNDSSPSFNSTPGVPLPSSDKKSSHVQGNESCLPKIPPPPPPLPPGHGPFGFPPRAPPPRFSINGIPPPPPPPIPGFGCGGGPPPPPPPPNSDDSHFSSSTKSYLAGPKKKMLQPNQRMKPMYWSRVQMHDLQKRQVDTSKLIWNQLNEISLPIEDLEQEFCHCQPIRREKKKETKVKKKRVETAKFLDPKRSQQVGIFISSMKTKVSHLFDALVRMTTELDIDLLKGLYDLRPSKEEVKLITDHISAMSSVQDEEKKVALDRPEKFLYEMSLLPQFDERVACIIFQDSFKESTESLSCKLDQLINLIELFRNGDEIHNLLGMVLNLGNYLNGGNRTRGQADGFELEILGKLRDIKMNSGGNMLLFLARQYIMKYQINELENEPKCPLPNITLILKVSQMEFEAFSRDVNRLMKDHSDCTKKLQYVKNNAAEEDLEPFYTKTNGLLTSALKEIDRLGLKITATRESFRELMVLYYVKPRKPNLSPEPRDFFEKWGSFVSEFKEMWEREVRRFLKEAKLVEKREAQAKVDALRKLHHTSLDLERKSSPTTPKKAPRSLKSRLRESKTLDQIAK